MFCLLLLLGLLLTDQRMFKFRWQKYQLYLKTLVSKSERTKQYMFLKQSAPSDNLETRNEHGGCESSMYNCPLTTPKCSLGDSNVSMRPCINSGSLIAPRNVAIARSMPICKFIAAAVCVLAVLGQGRLKQVYSCRVLRSNSCSREEKYYQTRLYMGIQTKQSKTLR